MNNFNFSEFRNNLQKDFSVVSQIVSSIENFIWNKMHSLKQEHNSYAESENDFVQEQLVERLEVIKLKIDFAYEYLGLTKMSDKFDDELKKYEGKYDTINYIPHVDVAYSPVEWLLTKHLNALTCHVKIDSESEYEKRLLEQVLRGTPKMLLDREVEPKNEAEVRKEVYKTLIHVFPDTVREIPIAKISKTYKPDIGVKRLKSAIEYKYVSSEQEAKSSIGGIFEDIHGYEGSLDWTTFYAVIYMTAPFMTQDQVEAEFSLSNAPHHWKPIVVGGYGEREYKSKKREKGV